MVDALDVVAIHDHEIVIRVLGENIHPEIDIGLDRGRTRERERGFRRRVGRRRAYKRDRERKRRDSPGYSIGRQLRSEQHRLQIAHESPSARFPPGPFTERADCPLLSRLYEIPAIAALVNKFRVVARCFGQSPIRCSINGSQLV